MKFAVIPGQVIFVDRFPLSAKKFRFVVSDWNFQRREIRRSVYTNIIVTLHYYFFVDSFIMNFTITINEVKFAIDAKLLNISFFKYMTSKFITRQCLIKSPKLNG